MDILSVRTGIAREKGQQGSCIITNTPVGLIPHVELHCAPVDWHHSMQVLFARLNLDRYMGPIVRGYCYELRHEKQRLYRPRCFGLSRRRTAKHKDREADRGTGTLRARQTIVALYECPVIVTITVAIADAE